MKMKRHLTTTFVRLWKCSKTQWSLLVTACSYETHLQFEWLEFEHEQQREEYRCFLKIVFLQCICISN